MRPAEFWSNATSAPLCHGDMVTEAEIATKIHLVKVIFINHCHFKDLYNQYDIFYLPKYFTRWCLETIWWTQIKNI